MTPFEAFLLLLASWLLTSNWLRRKFAPYQILGRIELKRHLLRKQGIDVCKPLNAKASDIELIVNGQVLPLTADESSKLVRFLEQALRRA